MGGRPELSLIWIKLPRSLGALLISINAVKSGSGI
jgi:hypothetical protein